MPDANSKVEVRDTVGDSCMDNANDALRVNVVAGSAGGVTHVDDAPFTPGTDDVVPIAAVFNDTLPDLVDEDDAGAVRMSANRNLYTTLRDAAGNERGVNVNASNQLSVSVDNLVNEGQQTMANSISVAIASDQGAVTVVSNKTNNGGAPGTNNLGVLPAVANAVAPTQTEGNQVALRATLAGDLVVTLDSEAVTVAQATAASLNAEVQGDAAHDVTTTGNPVLVGAASDTAEDVVPGAQRVSADGEAVRLAANRDGALYVLPHGQQIWSYHENSSSALTDTSVHATPGAGLSLYVTSIAFSTGAATAWNIFFEEGASTVLGPWYLEAVAGRGAVINFQVPKKITANTALTVTTSAAIAHSIDVTGYVAP